MTQDEKTTTAKAIYGIPSRNITAELLKYALIAFLIMLPIRLFVAQPLIVTGASMSPTFNDGDYLVIGKLSYAHATPERGDVVIFRYPLDPSMLYIKRVVGLPGETVELNNGVISIMERDGIRHIFHGSHLRTGYTQLPLITTLAADEYYVLGDNRDESSDSRQWGPLLSRYIVGRAVVRVLPLARAGLWPGSIASTTVQ